VCTQIFPTLSGDAEAPAALTERVGAGMLGAKTGQGLFAHDPAVDAATRSRMAEHFRIEFDADG